MALIRCLIGRTVRPGRLLVMLLATLVVSLSSCSRPAQYFKTPDAALNALEQAVAARSKDKANEIFGSDGDYILHTGDPIIDKKRGQQFVTLFNEQHRLEQNSDGSYQLLMGHKDWPFPVPLVEDNQGWYFDSEVGREEITARLIGSNELSAMRISRAIYVAQRSYAANDWNADGKKQYASRIISTPGTRDGLFWPADVSDSLSPLGPLIAKAADKGYTPNPEGTPIPVRGYYYQLRSVSSSDPAAKDVLSKPGKYWLISYPAIWGTSGIMTFASNERGWIYEKNLEDPSRLLKQESISIDDSWTRVE